MCRLKTLRSEERQDQLANPKSLSDLEGFRSLHVQKSRVEKLCDNYRENVEPDSCVIVFGTRQDIE